MLNKIEFNLELSDRAERIRRNLLIFSAIPLAFSFFGIQISSINFSGIGIINITDNTFYGLMLCLLCYETPNYLSTVAWEAGNKYIENVATMLENYKITTHPSGTIIEKTATQTGNLRAMKIIYMIKIRFFDILLPIALGITSTAICIYKLTFYSVKIATYSNTI